MHKSTFFTGQPIFNQILNFIPRSMVNSLTVECQSDHYCKRFGTYTHLVTMLYAVYNQCTSIREVITGLLAWEKRIVHLGIDHHPRRSTLSDANKRRSHEVFEKIYFKLVKRYESFLPDSHRPGKGNFYIFDSTTITLSQEILKGSGRSKSDGKRKGGIKVHTLLNARQDMPCMIRYSPGASNDVKFLKEIQLPAGSVIVFDKAYRDYSTYNRFDKEHITWVTRLKGNSVYRVLKKCSITDHHIHHGVTDDCIIQLGHYNSKKAIKVKARMVSYCDPATKKCFQFITNNQVLSPLTIANYYRKRWQIETFFKRIKQNYPLQYFLGDNENAIKIQIWCSLIADLILRVLKRGTRSSMAFSNIVGLVRLHLMTYLSLKDFLKSPEKSLLRQIQQYKQLQTNPSLFPT